MPPSQGVSLGPKMVAVQIKRESSERGDALQPAGGSCLIALRSLISRSMADVVPWGMASNLIYFRKSRNGKG
jgi:hypothetical protein